jgi:hypothetical protein
MRYLVMLMVILICTGSQAQETTDTLDLSEVVRNMFGKKGREGKSNSGFALLPGIGYNPTFGLMLGVTITSGKYLGDPKTTRLSTATLTTYVTTNGILNLQFRHNAFTKNDTWNLQGNAQITRMVLIDYGLGPATGKMGKEGMSISQYTLENTDDSYPIKFNYIRFFEKAYKKVSNTIMVGAGVSMDYHFDIDDQNLNLDSGKLTPHYTYNVENGFNPANYWTNGFLLNIQYNTKEHPNRSYGGTYADFALRVNPTFLGSTKNSTQILTEFRKYISLSKSKPERVLAFWHLGTFNLGGVLPYLDLPGTGTDMYNRSGRAYTIARFRGPSYFYLESEYRFPITRNKFLSGVAFLNMQSMSDGKDKALFSGWEPGAGGGIRILFNRSTRTNICIDYAVGLYGAKGLFFGLNEVF